MSLLISTQSYQNDTPTPYGLLLELDEKNGKIINKTKIDTPVESEEGGRLKPGLRGLYQYKSKIYTCSWNSVFVMNKNSCEIEKVISHKWMSDLHGLFVNEDGIWVTSSYPDALILYDFDGNPISSLWIPETHIYQERSEVDKNMDWRKKGKDFRGFREFHANHVEVKDDFVYVTGRGEKLKNGRIIRFPKTPFVLKGGIEDADINIYYNGLYGPHDGIWKDSNLWVTETNRGSIAQINTKQKISFRKKVLGKEGEKIKYANVKDYFRTNLKRLRGKPVRQSHWTRGLCITDESIFVGQSTWAGDKSLARVVEIDRANSKIKNCLYLDVLNYPETRIFQLIYI